MQAAIVLTRWVLAAQAAVDVVLTPMLAQLPRPVGWFTEGGDPAEDFRAQLEAAAGWTGRRPPIW